MITPMLIVGDIVNVRVEYTTPDRSTVLRGTTFTVTQLKRDARAHSGVRVYGIKGDTVYRCCSSLVVGVDYTPEPQQSIKELQEENASIYKQVERMRKRIAVKLQYVEDNAATIRRLRV